jgi:hypothetical protein
MRNIVAPPRPLIPVASPATRAIAKRLDLVASEQNPEGGKPQYGLLVRKHFIRNEGEGQLAKSKYETRGVKKMEARSVPRVVATEAQNKKFR